MGSIFGKLLKRRSAAAAVDARVHYAQGLAAASKGDLTGAIALLDQVIAIDPSHADAFYKRGNALKDLGNLEAAVHSYDQAIAIQANYTFAYCNRGVLQHRLGHLPAALTSFDQAIRLDPNDGLTHYNRALLLQDLARWEEALASYDAAVEVNPNHSEARYNRSLAQLCLGRFEEGWRGYEWRWRHAQHLSIGNARNFSQPLWLGEEDIGGKRLLLHAEGGFGDTLQFCRFAALCAARGATVILEVQPALVSLLSTLQGPAEVIAAGAPLPAFDYHTPLMSLPLAFRTTQLNIPSPHGYLRADAGLVTGWKNRLGPPTQPRIGIAWSGNPNNWIDARRSIALAEWAPHLPSGLTYFCIQRDIRPADKAYLERTGSIETFDSSLLDFTSTAALCQCLDLCISVDSSPAHLSGALGGDTWIPLAHNPDWRWMRDRQDTPWYSNVRLFRQSQPGDWRSVFSDIAAELHRRFPQAR